MSGPRFTVAMRGYDRTQVDAHCSRIEATLAGTAGTLAITAEEAVNPVFTIVLRGYDPREVEAWVRAQAALLSGGTGAAPLVRHSEVLRVAERPAGERFTVVRLAEGYDIGDVDAFLDRVRTTVGTTLSADEVQRVQFTTVRLRAGYDMRAVDDYLDEVVAELQQPPGAPAPAAPVAAEPEPEPEPSTTQWRESLSERYELLRVAERPRGERFGRTGLTKGYDADQVDAFVDEVRGTLTSTLTRDDVVNVHFDDARGGYRHREVDAWLVALEEHTRS
ncbi:DivIVA domain-containing protein [Jiangella endophytica]|uniref:DivIVA domain-containing protein n=1 Tax=Jiangella endophytica TaxID=1623398 RepID=UPI000E353C9B|nr:DivIVA domain-containing protein [Jiangella endophytica]